MNNRVGGFRKQDGSSSDESGTQRGSIAVIELFGQMMLLPLSVFVYGMELFMRTVQGMEKAADEGMALLVGSTSQTFAEADNLTQTSRETRGNEVMSNAIETFGVVPSSDSGLESSLAISSSDSGVNNDAKNNVKETIKMNDTDLSDDMLKLVRYKILFVKRDYETAFPEREELVYDNITGDAFTAWKVAEFIQRLGREEVPLKWLNKNYPIGRKYTDDEKKQKVKAYIDDMSEDDKKYLRVYYEVMARYEREEARYAEDQIAVLKDIRDRL